MQKFATERLIIRPLAEQDQALYIALYTSTEVMQNICPPLSEQEADKAFRNTIKIMTRAQPKIMTWAIVNSANNETIGILGLTWPKKKQPIYPSKVKIVVTQKDIKQVELGIIISSKAHRMGFAQEAITALLHYSFNCISLDKINVFYATKNLASKQLFDKLNFISDVTLEHSATESGYLYIDRQHWQQKYIH